MEPVEMKVIRSLTGTKQAVCSFGCLTLLVKTVLVLCLSMASCFAAAKQLKPTVLLISIDGFRYDYPEISPSPTIQSLISSGVRADALIPQFPTLTFPNHYAIVTGLTPAHNGIVANTMYDPKIHAMFKMSDDAQVTDARWWKGEPIWVTAEKQHQKSGTLFWPGSEASIQDIRPTYWRHYDKKISDSDRVKQILQWLDLPDAQRPTFLTLYFDRVDTAGHDYGPNSAEVKNAIRMVDDALGELVTGLQERGIYDNMNIVIVSDHGMAETSCDRVVDVRKALNKKSVVAEHGAILSVYVKGPEATLAFEKLKTLPHLTVYRKTGTPLRWEYRGNPRIADIVAVADEGWTVRTADPTDKEKEKGCVGGKHGYDNFLPSLSGIFIAHGPAFLPGSRIPPFDNLSIYDLVAHILKLAPAPNDGSLAPFTRVLRDTQ
jgi:predicted AlkP superfamily pyrophosphatase or phosphodiesterase